MILIGFPFVLSDSFLVVGSVDGSLTMMCLGLFGLNLIRVLCPSYIWLPIMFPMFGRFPFIIALSIFLNLPLFLAFMNSYNSDIQFFMVSFISWIAFFALFRFFSICLINCVFLNSLSYNFDIGYLFQFWFSFSVVSYYVDSTFKGLGHGTYLEELSGFILSG